MKNAEMYVKNGNPKDKKTNKSKDEELRSLQRLLNESELQNKKLKY